MGIGGALRKSSFLGFAGSSFGHHQPSRKDSSMISLTQDEVTNTVEAKLRRIEKQYAVIISDMKSQIYEEASKFI